MFGNITIRRLILDKMNPKFELYTAPIYNQFQSWITYRAFLATLGHCLFTPNGHFKGRFVFSQRYLFPKFWYRLCHFPAIPLNCSRRRMSITETKIARSAANFTCKMPSLTFYTAEFTKWGLKINFTIHPGQASVLTEIHPPVEYQEFKMLHFNRFVAGAQESHNNPPAGRV